MNATRRPVPAPAALRRPGPQPWNRDLAGTFADQLARASLHPRTPDDQLVVWADLRRLHRAIRKRMGGPGTACGKGGRW